MTFRRATPDDAQSILRFWKDLCASMSTTDEVGYVRRITTNPMAVFLLAIAENEIIGSLIRTFDGWRGNMYRLVVHQGRRRQGIGRQLVHQVEQAFSEWDVRRVTVLIEVDRPTAMEFWSAVGYPRDTHVVRHLGVMNAGRE